MRRTIYTISFLLFLIGCSKNPDKRAPLFKDLGTFNYPITTNSELAQKYFNQGVVFSYGFNHQEAFRSFQEVARLDTNAAMAYWGMALVLGPNINLPMDNSTVKTAYDAIQKAISLIDNESQKEKDWIMALLKRYAKEPPKDRSPLDSAYADAMRKLSAKYPDDIDIKTMFAESLMDQHPWDFWLKDGTPKPWTPEIISTLESTLQQKPDHIGANHLYIHATEASQNPQRALVCADRLKNLVPGAGHLVHMPAHIYIRTGRYHEGSLANERAVKSDEEYLAQCHQEGFYPLGYYPHNYHFLWATATMEGDSKTAINAALKVSSKPPDSLLEVCDFMTLQHFVIIPLYAYVTFGKWDEILKYPEPPKTRPYVNGIWHYARGMAFMAKNNFTEAEKELAMLDILKKNENVEKFIIAGINSAGTLLKIGYEVLAGEIEAKKNNNSLALKHLNKAVEIENTLRYDEPPTWFSPAKLNLGAVLIQAGKYTEAEKIYLQHLKEYPENGWALYGLYQALVKEKKNTEAADIQKRFTQAWKYADVQLTSSRIL